MFRPTLVLVALLAFVGPTAAEGVKKKRHVGNPGVDGIAIPFMRYLENGHYVARRPHNGRFTDANSGWIVGEKGILIIDPPSDVRVTNIWLNWSEEKELPIRFIINTHWHGDHTEGNARLQEEIAHKLRIIGHKSLIEDVPGLAGTRHAADVKKWREQVPLAEKALAEGKGLQGQVLSEEQKRLQAQGIARTVEWLESHGEAAFLPPTETYNDRFTLDIGGEVLELYHFKAHTRGDTVVLLKDRKIAFSGDVLDEIPYIGDGYPRSWLKALDVMAGWDVEVFVPGHGNTLSGAHIDKVRGFLKDLIAQVDTARAAGKTLEQAKQTIDLSVWRQKLAFDPPSVRFFDGSLNAAIEAAWREVEGS